MIFHTNDYISLGILYPPYKKFKDLGENIFVILQFDALAASLCLYSEWQVSYGVKHWRATRILRGTPPR